MLVRPLFSVTNNAYSNNPNNLNHQVNDHDLAVKIANSNVSSSSNLEVNQIAVLNSVNSRQRLDNQQIYVIQSYAQANSHNFEAERIQQKANKHNKQPQAYKAVNSIILA